MQFGNCHKDGYGDGDYAVTEAGFGADLGAEKFLDIKCRAAGLVPDAVVLVATVRALKMHGGLPKTRLTEENLDALEKGLPNLMRHLKNITRVYKLPCVVAVNRFPTDTDAEIETVIAKCREAGVNVRLSTVWADGGAGGEELAKEVVRLCETPNQFTYSYDLKQDIKSKITAVVQKVYGGVDINVCRRRKNKSPRFVRWAFPTYPSVSPKRNTAFRTTRRCWARRRILPSR